MKVILLGSGYVGMELLRKWNTPKFIVTTTTTEKIPSLIKIPSVEQAVLCWGSDLSPLLPYIDLCDGIVVTVAPKGGNSYEDTYLKTAQSLRDLLRARGKPLHLIYTSSISAFRKPVLLETEKIYLNGFNQSVSTTILRLGGIYGPGRTIEERAKRLSGMKMMRSANEYTNHIHLADIVKAIQFSFEHTLLGDYNLVNDAHPTLEELYSPLCNEPPTFLLGQPFSNEKIKQVGFTFGHQELFE
ncbi:hypothetical protein N9Y92_00580 [Chlamydiales bacterium]|nr:hypothetical protein [Chlamydiales bacterium]